MFILRLTFFTCVFYMAIGVLIEAGLIALTHRTGAVVMYFSSRTGIVGFASFFGIIWVFSLLLAFRMVFANVWSRFVGQQESL